MNRRESEQSRSAADLQRMDENEDERFTARRISLALISNKGFRPNRRPLPKGGKEKC